MDHVLLCLQWNCVVCCVLNEYVMLLNAFHGCVKLRVGSYWAL